VDADILTRALPGTVLAELKRRGIPPGQVAAAVDASEGDLVALTGSYATGEANVTSDLDFTVITADPARRRVAHGANHPSILGDSFDVRVGSLQVNIEYVHSGRLEDICAIIDSVRATPDHPDLPNLQALELRLLQRLASGKAITGRPLLDEYQSRIDLETARAASISLSFVGGLSLLEDAQVMIPPARELMFRSAAESLLVSAVNTFGPITYDVKHLCSRAIRLAGEQCPARALQELEGVLSADRLAPRQATVFLLDVAEDLYHCFGDARCPAVVAPMLAPFRDMWAWTGRRFP
jgi:predicted nucleotidyltransferase